MIKEKIEEYLAQVKKDKLIAESYSEELAEITKYNFMRQFIEEHESRPTLRLSSIGHCPRKQAYQMLGEPENGKELDARSKMVFYDGDCTEAVMVALASLAGVPLKHSGKDQLEVEFEGIKGHPDGVIKDPKEDYLFECKSMNMYSFWDFDKKGIIDKSYLFQVNCYMDALGLDKCVFLAKDKNSGHYAEAIVEKSEVLVSEAKQIIADLKKITADTMPERPYKKSDKGFDWHCDYCAFSMTCWPNTEYKWNGKRKVLTDKGE